MDIFKDAVEDSAAKITKSFEKILIEVGRFSCPLQVHPQRTAPADTQ